MKFINTYKKTFAKRDFDIEVDVYTNEVVVSASFTDENGFKHGYSICEYVDDGHISYKNIYDSQEDAILVTLLSVIDTAVNNFVNAPNCELVHETDVLYTLKVHEKSHHYTTLFYDDSMREMNVAVHGRKLLIDPTENLNPVIKTIEQKFNCKIFVDGDNQVHITSSLHFYDIFSVNDIENVEKRLNSALAEMEKSIPMCCVEYIPCNDEWDIFI